MNLSRYLKEFRFHEIKRFMPFLFADETIKDTDPWWQFKSAVDLYNKNRKETVSASLFKTFDESMSAFHPRTTRYGNLPHLSNIARKPEPLGTEFKVTNSTKIGLCLYLEIQRGKQGMANEKYNDDMKKMAACSVRMAEGTRSCTSNDERHGRQDTYLGDSWFASVDVVVELRKRLNAQFIGIIKTNHSKFPKKWLESTMKNWPPGSHLVLETTCEGVDVVACGYKYNKRKVCCFVFTKGAGHTQEGKPYVAKWRDDNNNTRTRNVPHPDVISKYFGCSNVVDLFNQSRQFDLKLEKH